MHSMCQVCIFLRGSIVELLKRILPASRESDETRLADAPCFRYDSGDRNAVEQHGGERLSDRHERCSPSVGRVHWAARSSVCNRYVIDDPRSAAAG